jgi:hypothetical protein
MPDGDDFKRVSEVFTQIGELIKKDIPDSRADDEAKGQEEDEVLEQCPPKSETAGPRLNAYKKIGSKEAEQVHEAVPANLNWPDLE